MTDTACTVNCVRLDDHDVFAFLTHSLTPSTDVVSIALLSITLHCILWLFDINVDAVICAFILQ